MVRQGAGLAVHPSDAGGRTWRSLFGNPAGSPWLVAGAVTVLYGLWLVLFFHSSHDVRDLIDIGRKFAQQSTTSPLIQVDPRYHYEASNLGQDGQFAYYLALDPRNARYYMDYPAYRYARVLYPMVARMLALGQPGLIPYSMILINWLAVGGGTFFVAAWLRRRQYSPWVALVYGLGAGVFVAFRFDLTEPLCYALVALAVYFFDSTRPFRVVLAGISFALAALARETALVFAIPYGLALLFEPGTTGPWRARLGANFRQASLLLVLAVTPMALYRVFLLMWLGS